MHFYVPPLRDIPFIYNILYINTLLLKNLKDLGLVIVTISNSNIIVARIITLFKLCLTFFNNARFNANYIGIACLLILNFKGITTTIVTIDLVYINNSKLMLI